MRTLTLSSAVFRGHIRFAHPLASDTEQALRIRLMEVYSSISLTAGIPYGMTDNGFVKVDSEGFTIDNLNNGGILIMPDEVINSIEHPALDTESFITMREKGNNPISIGCDTDGKVIAANYMELAKRFWKKS